MHCLELVGGKPLQGVLTIQGSKNAVLPVLAACIPGEGVCIIENCPDISDVRDTLAIMRGFGCRITFENNTVTVDASELEAEPLFLTEAVRIRSSILFLGALLGRIKTMDIPLPGGCEIGRRPVDYHLQGLSRMGAQFTCPDVKKQCVCHEKTEMIHAAVDHFRGAEICLPMPSVGATENIILAAVQAEGKTVIYNAAREPEIDTLCSFLRLRGAKIRRDPDGTIEILGGSCLESAKYRIGPDRIVNGTYLLAAAGAGGDVTITNGRPEELAALLNLLEKMGMELSYDPAPMSESAEIQETPIRICSEGRPHSIAQIETSVYPGFPTDMQALAMAALCRARGVSRIRERIFEHRFRTAAELCRMGADISVSGDHARITGVEKLHPAIVKAPDLRGAAALVIAALQTEGITEIQNMEHMERGYENICQDLSLLGVQVIKWAEQTEQK